MTLTPQANLAYGQEHRLSLSADLESFALQTLDDAVEISFAVADPPETALEKRDYLWTLQFPPNDQNTQSTDRNSFAESSFVVHVAPSVDGGFAEIELTDDLTASGRIVISGMQLQLPALSVVIDVGNFGSFFPGTWPSVGEVRDDDGDGWMDSATGVLRVAGPGFSMDEVPWKLQPL